MSLAAPVETRGDAYDSGFFEGEAATSSRSAGIIVPILASILNPTSVVDVGCGVGAFLKAFADLGVQDLHGVEGDWARSAPRVAPSATYHFLDVESPIQLGRRFDLALCLEVAEHIDETSADTLIGTLVSLAPAVCFSAAVPGQGGTHHVNERWPEYWAAKFRARGYACFDVIRPLIRRNPAIPTWYAQNILVYTARDSPAFSAVSRSTRPIGGRAPFLVRDLAHPVLARGLNMLPSQLRETIYLRYRTSWKRHMPAALSKYG